MPRHSQCASWNKIGCHVKTDDKKRTVVFSPLHRRRADFKLPTPISTPSTLVCGGELRRQDTEVCFHHNSISVIIHQILQLPLNSGHQISDLFSFNYIFYFIIIVWLLWLFVNWFKIFTFHFFLVAGDDLVLVWLRGEQ
jgi:hypothetical protein